MTPLNQVQTYLANLGVLTVKWHNTHWIVVGSQFMRVHTFTKELYDQLFEDFDAVTEILKMKNVTPLSAMKDYLANATVKEVDPKDFSKEESLKIVKEDLVAMRSLATDIWNTADENGDFEVVAAFEDYVAFTVRTSGSSMWC